MFIEYVTHASLRIWSERVQLLTDPFFFFEPSLARSITHFPARPIRPSSWGRLDHVYCSHIHFDHSHPLTLARLKPNIGTILLPEGRPDLLERIRSLGFPDVILLPHEERRDLGNGLFVTSYHHPNGVDSALLVELDGVSVLHANDCLLDAETTARIAGRCQVDHAFIPHTSNQDLFPFLLDRPRRVLRDFAEGRERADVAGILRDFAPLNARRVTPYAYTVAYRDEDLAHINFEGRTTPPVFARMWNQQVAPTAVVLQPGDVVDGWSGEKVASRRGPGWGTGRSGFRRNLMQRLRAHPTRTPSWGNAAAAARLLDASYGSARWGAPRARWLRDLVVALHLQGRDGTVTRYVDAERRRTWTTAPSPPAFAVTMPAALVKPLLQETYDPYMALYCYRIRFASHVPRVLSAVEECELYVALFVALFGGN